MEQDPVCRMYLVKVEEKLKIEYKGKTYYFCCSSCKILFEKDPENYIRNVTPKADNTLR